MPPLPRACHQAGVILLALYPVHLLAPLWPPLLSDSSWQLSMGTALVQGAPLALIGLLLLQMAAFLAPQQRRLRRRGRRAAALAVPAAGGFLLLLPLLSLAGLRQLQRQDEQYHAQSRVAAAQLQAMRQAVAVSVSTRDLEQRLMALQGPQLDGPDRQLSLPLLRQRVTAVLDRAAAQLDRGSTSSPREAERGRARLAILRTLLSCPLLAVGFAALAQRRRSSVSLLEDCRLLVRALPRRFRHRR